MDNKKFITQKHFDDNLLLSKDKRFPKISIVIPSYNQAQFLEKTILSILNQNYPNLEVIIIDGGSKDESIGIIKRYERYLAFWVSEQDNGQAHAINKGFKIASGDIVAWQNSDDIYLPDTFHKVIKVLEKYKDAELIFGNIYLIDSNDRILDELRFVPFSTKDLLYLDWNIGSQAAFWRKRVIDRVGLLREDISTCFDYDWFIRLGNSAGKIRFTRDFLGGYRIHNEAKLSTINYEKRWPILVDIYRRHGISIKDENPFNEQFKIYRLLMLLRRLLYYVLQRDFDYIIRTMVRVIKRKGIYAHRKGQV